MHAPSDDSECEEVYGEDGNAPVDTFDTEKTTEAASWQHTRDTVGF